MRGVNPGEVWIIDFGMAAKVRPALLLTGEPAPDELAREKIEFTESAKLENTVRANLTELVYGS